MGDPSALDLSLPPGLPDDGRGSVVTVGTFDGVHRGHRAVLGKIVERASETGRRAVLVTFDPHPLRIVRPEIAPRLLTTPTEKKEILAETGLDYAVFLKFTPVLSRYSPRRFVEEVLLARVRVEQLVIGYDHGFGRGRAGDAELLREIGAELGFEVDVVDSVEMGSDPVSSTRIRRAVAEGDLSSARRGLGRPYSLRGFVVRGDGRGTGLGFPTANLKIESTDKLLPPAGVYAVRVVLRTGEFAGALHLGPRPTFQGSPPSIEVHLIEFSGNLYGEEMRVDLIECIRPIESFESVAELVRRIARDVALAKEIVGPVIGGNGGVVPEQGSR